MLIQDVLKENKPFRRYCCPPFMTLVVRNGYMVWLDTGEKATLPVKDFLKEDWIVVDENFSLHQ